MGWILDAADPGDSQRRAQVQRHLSPVNKHVYLTGFMGAGKTTVGRALAKLLGWPFVDLDSRIASEHGMTIAEIFAERGEHAFRRLESLALQSLNDSPALVVATGGGVLSSPESRDWIRDHGTAVWLDVPYEVLLERLNAEERGARPLFENESQARELFALRHDQYGDSDLQIEVLSADSVADVAGRIHQTLLEEKCVT